MEGICTTLTLCIHALEVYTYYYIAIYLKDVIWHYHEERENEIPVKNTCYTILLTYLSSCQRNLHSCMESSDVTKRDLTGCARKTFSKKT